MGDCFSSGSGWKFTEVAHIYGLLFSFLKVMY
jgi:hypothetical protein